MFSSENYRFSSDRRAILVIFVFNISSSSNWSRRVPKLLLLLLIPRSLLPLPSRFPSSSPLSSFHLLDAVYYTLPADSALFGLAHTTRAMDIVPLLSLLSLPPLEAQLSRWTANLPDKRRGWSPPRTFHMGLQAFYDTWRRQRRRRNTYPDVPILRIEE